MYARYIQLLIAACVVASAYGQSSAGTQLPRLVVNITIDQLRSDYLQAFMPLYGQDGFRRLMEQGAVYDNAAYPFSPIDRASAMAALATGATPYYNSITGNRWLQRETLRPVEATLHDLACSTVADELKVASKGKAVVYSVAPMRDMAELAAGHAADGAMWLDDRTGRWDSSTGATNTTAGWTAAYNQLHALPQDCEWVPANQLAGNFSYFIGGGMQKPFRHKLGAKGGYRQMKASGLVNQYITDAALQCLSAGAMGSDTTPDMLAVGYYAGLFDGQPLDDCQTELQDTYVRLDTEIARLVGEVEKRVGGDRIIITLTSTGYQAEERIDYTRYGVPAGTLDMVRTSGLLDMYFGAVWGTAKYVETTYGGNIYLDHKLFETKHISLKEACSRAQEFLAMLSGVRNVYTSLQLLTEATNQQISRIRSGFHPEHGGDIFIEAAPGWTITNTTFNEQYTSRASCLQFPLIIYGAGVKAGRIPDATDIDRLAPTIAKTIRIRAPNACAALPLN